MIHKTSMFYDPCFSGPPPEPPFFEDPPFSRGCSHPLPPTPVWPYDVVLSFDLLSWGWCSSTIIMLDLGYTYKIFIILINFYKYSWFQSTVYDVSSCIRVHDSSSRVLLQKNTFPITHHHGKTSLFYPPYSPRTYSSSVYRPFLPFYRVKNPISPSLPYVFRLTPSPLLWPKSDLYQGGTELWW